MKVPNFIEQSNYQLYQTPVQIKVKLVPTSTSGPLASLLGDVGKHSALLSLKTDNDALGEIPAWGR